MADKDVTQVNTEEQDQTVTREQFDEMNSKFEASEASNADILKMVENLKKSNSGADQKVTELLKQIEEQKEQGKSEEEKFADRIKAIETELSTEKEAKQQAILKGVAISLLSEKGLKPPKYLDRLIGKDAVETEANINSYIEERLELELNVADEFAKNNGRKVARNKGDVKTMDDYSDAEITAMSSAEFEKVQARSKK